MVGIGLTIPAPSGEQYGQILKVDLAVGIHIPRAIAWWWLGMGQKPVHQRPGQIEIVADRQVSQALNTPAFNGDFGPTITVFPYHRFLTGETLVQIDGALEHRFVFT